VPPPPSGRFIITNANIHRLVQLIGLNGVTLIAVFAVVIARAFRRGSPPLKPVPAITFAVFSRKLVVEM